jgi:hydroxyacylglutathione hydrolase
MKLRRVETPGLVHYAYVFGERGVGAVVDPRRDVDEYLEVARELGLRVEFVLETHRQEDFVMGSRRLAARIGAKIVNGPHPCFGTGDLRLADGDELELGGLRIQAWHTPGHTPESMCYALYLAEERDSPWAVFTGDALLFGDTGRTDLPDPEGIEQHAGQLHDSIRHKLAPLPDETLIFPAHGPGSVCGSGLADRPLSTLGLERRSNPVFTLGREAFAARHAAQRLPRPPYFRHMEVVNRGGDLGEARRRGEVPLLDAEVLAGRDEAAVLIDTREPEAFAGGHIGGAYSIWLRGLVSFAGWVAAHDQAIYLCTDTHEDVDEAALALARIGLDEVRGALRGGFGSWRASGRAIEHTGVITASALRERLDEFAVLDVREADEFAEEHIPTARHTYVGHLEAALPELELERDRPLVVTCSVGHRASLAVSILARAGFTDVRNLLGGMKAWGSDSAENPRPDFSW